jgi:hypothetical protein
VELCYQTFKYPSASYSKRTVSRSRVLEQSASRSGSTHFYCRTIKNFIDYEDLNFVKKSLSQLIKKMKKPLKSQCIQYKTNTEPEFQPKPDPDQILLNAEQ